MYLENRNETTPARTHARVRLSTSTSISTSDEKLLSFSDNLNSEDNLSNQINEFWNVQDSPLVILEYGAAGVARVHRRMLYMSRRQKLNHVESLENYFMSCLLPRRKRAEVDTERSDKFYEDYLAKQKERGL